MVPDLDLQLQVVMKALTDTVMPALDPAQRVAHEQLGLAVATLGMIRERLPSEPAREWRALADAVELAKTVNAAPADADLSGADLSGAIDAAQALLAAGNPPVGARKQATRRLLAAISAIARAPGTPRSVLAIIIDKSGPSTDLARAWCMAAGFEPDPDEVPALEALLQSAP